MLFRHFSALALGSKYVQNSIASNNIGEMEGQTLPQTCKPGKRAKVKSMKRPTLLAVTAVVVTMKPTGKSRITRRC
jgi:hypothetical protein